MNKLMSIFGAIIFASFIMTSCGGGSAEASGEATTEAMAPEASVETMAAGTPEAAPAAVATDAKASEEVKATK